MSLGLAAIAVPLIAFQLVCELCANCVQCSSAKRALWRRSKQNWRHWL